VSYEPKRKEGRRSTQERLSPGVGEAAAFGQNPGDAARLQSLRAVGGVTEGGRR
jgi:hypothetical protein